MAACGHLGDVGHMSHLSHLSNLSNSHPKWSPGHTPGVWGVIIRVCDMGQVWGTCETYPTYKRPAPTLAPSLWPLAWPLWLLPLAPHHLQALTHHAPTLWQVGFGPGGEVCNSFHGVSQCGTFGTCLTCPTCHQKSHQPLLQQTQGGSSNLDQTNYEYRNY